MFSWFSFCVTKSFLHIIIQRRAVCRETSAAWAPWAPSLENTAKLPGNWMRTPFPACFTSGRLPETAWLTCLLVFPSPDWGLIDKKKKKKWCFFKSWCFFMDGLPKLGLVPSASPKVAWTPFSLWVWGIENAYPRTRENGQKNRDLQHSRRQKICSSLTSLPLAEAIQQAHIVTTG